MLKSSIPSLVFLSALMITKGKKHQKPAVPDLISDDEQAEKIQKADEKRARKAAKRAKK